MYFQERVVPLDHSESKQGLEARLDAALELTEAACQIGNAHFAMK
jgi:hypothetical protein